MAFRPKCGQARTNRGRATALPMLQCYHVELHGNLRPYLRQAVSAQASPSEVVKGCPEMTQRDTLVSYLRDALAHLYDRPYLEVHPIGPLLFGQARTSTADDLRQLLLDTIEQLRPPEPCPPTARTWRRYRYLVLRYVEGAKPEHIARELQISVRESRREHDRALDAMATLLRARLRLPGEPEGPTPSLARVASTASDQATARDVPEESSLGAIGDELLKVGLLPPREPTSVAGVVHDALQVIERLIELRGARVEPRLSATLSPVWVHPLVLRQVLIDLLSCAVENHPQAVVQLSAVDGARWVRLEVDVLGSPPPTPTELVKVEARLAASRRLIELQAGSLRVVRREGTAFHAGLLLPFARTRRLLVVDDNPDVAYLFSRFLREHNYQVLLATNGEAALELAREAHPDVVTLDVLMPSQDGWDILRQLAGDPRTRHIPIILCSVLPERSLALSLGVAEFLSKPVTQQALLAALQRCVSAPEPD